ncbi:hypothetical protein FXO37_06139 [Capsicum annuum]|nr:hypothetical protein FXO37_06139 [Capsicum annuum]
MYGFHSRPSKFFYHNIGGIDDSSVDPFRGCSFEFVWYFSTPNVVPPPMSESGYGVSLVMSVGPPVVPTSVLGTPQTPNMIPSQHRYLSMVFQVQGFKLRLCCLLRWCPNKLGLLCLMIFSEA